MICRLCRAQEPYSLRFGDFGRQPFWCGGCRRKYREMPQTLVVPYGRNRLTIESLHGGYTEDEALLIELWFKAEKLLKKALSRPLESTIILWYDPLIDYTAPIWWTIFEGMDDILMISLFELDPIRWSKKDS